MYVCECEVEKEILPVFRFVCLWSERICSRLSLDVKQWRHLVLKLGRYCTSHSLYLHFLIYMFNHATICVFKAVARDASMVRRSLSCQRKKRCYHVSPVGHGDPERDRHQQSSAPPQTALGHPGDGLAHQPFSSPYV